ncbi:protein phosphatase 2C domain-containing protein [Kitasatospora sp. NPDC096147]|uniref:protein phosphatase 2C domain-containing protein n=1 Tax=Kitasatospora sp. NPDC096147 TaxID=3364093 RepID=UPI00381E78F9
MNVVSGIVIAVLAAGIIGCLILLYRLRETLGKQSAALAELNHLPARVDVLTKQLAAAQHHVAVVTAERDQLGGQLRLAEDRIRHGLGELDRLRAALAFHTDAVPEELQSGSPAVPRELPLGQDAAADGVVDGADLGPLVVRAASVRGTRRREDREHRRDAVRLQMVDGFGTPVLLSIVAPGAPQGLLSQSGATAACRALATRLATGAFASGVDVFDQGQDKETAALLRAALAGVAESVRLVARSTAAEVAGSDPEQNAATSLYAVITQLGDRDRRQHVVFGTGDAVLLQLAPPQPDGSGPVWRRAFEPSVAARRALLPPAGNAPVELHWGRFSTVTGDILALASRPMAELLVKDPSGAWFARRWSGRRPYLTTFLSDTNAAIRSTGGDRTLVCLWDHGSTAYAQSLPEG